MKPHQPPSGGLVYSTDGGRMCPTCRLPLDGCLCAAQARAQARGNGAVRVSREGRSGKTVTLVRGLPLNDAALAAMGKRLRTACGSGGTVKDGAIEVQGDHTARVLAWLQAEGFAARRSGS